jgi:peroxiredoxin
MAQLGSMAEEFRRAPVSVILIAAEKRGGMFKPEKFLKKHPLPFPFLLDEDRAVTKAYGIYHRLGLDAINIAHPATFVVDRSGIVRWIYVGNTQVDRAPVEQVLEAVANAQSG